MRYVLINKNKNGTCFTKTFYNQKEAITKAQNFYDCLDDADKKQIKAYYIEEYNDFEPNPFETGAIIWTIVNLEK